MKVRLTRKHAERIDGISLEGRSVGDVFDLRILKRDCSWPKNGLSESADSVPGRRSISGERTTAGIVRTTNIKHVGAVRATPPKVQAPAGRTVRTEAASPRSAHISRFRESALRRGVACGTRTRTPSPHGPSGCSQSRR